MTVTKKSAPKKNHARSLSSCAVLTLIGLAAMGASQTASADDDFTNPEWANSAWYIGAGAGATRSTIDQERITNSLKANGASSVVFNKNERDKGYKLFVGKQLNKNFAIEAGYFDLGKFSYNATTTSALNGAGTLNGDVSFRGLNADVLAQVPLTERFSVYGRIGANYAKSTANFSGNRLYAVTSPRNTENKLNPKVGLGLEYKFTEALAMRGEVERYRLNDAVGNRGDVDFVSLNLVYKLGQPARTTRVVAVEPAPTPMPAPVPMRVEPTPKPAAPVAVSEKATFSAEALFDFDKSVLKPEGKAAFDDLLTKLQGMNTEVMVTVGHTDSVGTDAYNQKLSLRRAESVKAYLVSKGVDASRVFTEGKGESQPVADNNTAEGRAKNRRVTIEVVGNRTVMK